VSTITSSAKFNTVYIIWYTYITIIMVSKSKQTHDKKMAETKDKLLEMAATQKITWEIYEEMAKIIDRKTELPEMESLSDKVDPPTEELLFESELLPRKKKTKKEKKKEKKKELVLNRALVPDEIPLPTAAPANVPPPPMNLATDLTPGSLPELAPGSVHEEEPAVGPDPEAVPDVTRAELCDHDYVQVHNTVENQLSDDDSWTLPIPNKDKGVSAAVGKIKTLKEIMKAHMKLIEIGNESNTETVPTVRKGFLFMICIRCPLGSVIRFSSGAVPLMPSPSSVQYKNGIVAMMCKTCEARASSSSTVSTPNDQTTSCVDQFSNLKLGPHLLKNSDITKAASLIANEHVDVIEFEGHVLYMDRNRIMDKIGPCDMIASLNLSKVESMDISMVLLPYLSGGFI
jgi:hypothetical protein